MHLRQLCGSGINDYICIDANIELYTFDRKLLMSMKYEYRKQTYEDDMQKWKYDTLIPCLVNFVVFAIYVLSFMLYCESSIYHQFLQFLYVARVQRLCYYICVTRLSETSIQISNHI